MIKNKLALSLTSLSLLLLPVLASAQPTVSVTDLPSFVAKIESAIQSLKDVMTGDNKDEIEAKTKDLLETSSKMAERVYAKKGKPDETGDACNSCAGGESEPCNEESKEKVVDAEFTEVKDEDKK